MEGGLFLSFFESKLKTKAGLNLRLASVISDDGVGHKSGLNKLLVISIEILIYNNARARYVEMKSDFQCKLRVTGYVCNSEKCKFRVNN